MSDLSEKVLTISVPYLGPAAKVFLERQTKSHMDGLVYDALEAKHLAELSKWVNISAGLLIDEGKAKELSDKIGTLK
jgi:hypothetical protein